MQACRDVQTCEDLLCRAMIGGDVEALDGLLSDALVFTGPMGNVMTKQEDLEVHRSQCLRIRRLDLFDVLLHPFGEIVVVTTKAKLEGTFDSHAVSGIFAYTRVWRNTGSRWLVQAGHCSKIAELSP